MHDKRETIGGHNFNINEMRFIQLKANNGEDVIFTCYINFYRPQRNYSQQTQIIPLTIWAGAKAAAEAIAVAKITDFMVAIA